MVGWNKVNPANRVGPVVPVRPPGISRTQTFVQLTKVQTEFIYINVFKLL